MSNDETTEQHAPQLTQDELNDLRRDVFAVMEKHAGLSGGVVYTHQIARTMEVLQEMTKFTAGKMFESTTKFSNPGDATHQALVTYAHLHDDMAMLLASVVCRVAEIDLKARGYRQVS